MITKIQYIDSTDRQTILDANINKFLIEEQNFLSDDNITKINFLIFTDIKPIEQEVTDLKKSNAELKIKVIETEQVVASNSLSYQKLLELLIESGVI